MTLAARMTRCPRPFDPGRGSDVLSVWPALDPALTGLIRGTAGCSPYLAGLLIRERDWCLAALEAPEAAVEAELARLAAAPPEGLGATLRQGKARLALLLALADLGGVWPLAQVTGLLTRLADTALSAALAQETAAEIRRGRLPGLTEGDDAGLVALAMGKMGARELNYSSDIDLILVCDETRHDRADWPTIRAGLIRVARRAVALLSDMTPEGYVFRTDLRLRPDASVTPVVLSMAAAELYYESEGRSWERAAYIKARPAAGDLAAGERFLRDLRPFVWRKHLDFAAIEDAHDMRLRIRDHKGLHGPLTLSGHDLKLGRGGIREIEFFTQTRQLIAGGRDESLRLRGTCEGLMALSAAGWVPPEAAQTLVAHYTAHREVEHRLQMIADAQTHSLPASDEGFARLAAFMDRDEAELRRDLTRRIEEVDALTDDFFAGSGRRKAPDPAPAFGAEVAARWPAYPALRSSRANGIFARIRPQILAELQKAARPEEALAEFDAFLAGLPSGVQVFSLFEANPQLTRLIGDICATAPALARYLGRNPAVLDAVIAGRFFAPWPGVEGLRLDLAERLGAAEDYERRLDRARDWMKDWHFRVGVHHLRGLIGPAEAGQHYADLAEAVVAGLWPEVARVFAARHGDAPGRGAMVLAMGSLGAGRLNAGSDLDLQVIYDDGGQEGSQGPKPLASRTYFARLTQALVTALTAPTASGRLYEVDMRLRPSGRQGPVAVSLAGFADYQLHEAWTWEHLALTRARPIAGSAALQAEFEVLRRAILREKSKAPALIRDAAEMRARIRAAKGAEGDWDAKIGPGRLQDVDLAAQVLALGSASPARDTPGQIAAGQAAGLCSAGEALVLREAHDLFWQMQAAARLLTGDAIDPGALGAGGLAFILRETGASDTTALAARLARVAGAAEAAVDRLLAVD